MSRRPSLRHSIQAAYPAFSLPLLVWATLASPLAHAGSGLQLAYNTVPRHDKHIAAPVSRTETDNYVPLRLEYEMVMRVEKMIGTTKEIHAIIEAMPGPKLPVNVPPAPPPPPVHYATPIEETRARLDHVAQMIEDVTRLIEAMPPADGTGASPAQAAQDISAAPPPVMALWPGPGPAPEPDKPVMTTTVRAVILISSGLMAAVLGYYLRRRFLRRRPTLKAIAAAIEPPPLKDDAIELADVLISMGIAGGAAQALVERIQANPRQALSHWLKLLEVYRHNGKRAEFEHAVEEIRATFNVYPGSWNASRNIRPRPKTSLESYPHIAMQLKKLWPSPTCVDYLLSLLADNRDGKRIGFPVVVVEEIILLLAVLRSILSEGGGEPRTDA